MLQNHHVPGMVFLYKAVKENEDDLTFIQMIALALIHLWVNTGKKGDHDIFTTNEVWSLIPNVLPFKHMWDLFKIHEKNGNIKKVGWGKYILTDKGNRMIKTISTKFSRYFYFFEQSGQEFNFL